MSLWQVVEKDGYATDWALVRYNEQALSRFSTKEEAEKAAYAYLTDRNVNNALTKDEKLHNFECFMQTDEGCFLGILDGQPWYLTHPKDVVRKGDVKYAKGEAIKDPTSTHLLEGKTEVSVRVLPGS